MPWFGLGSLVLAGFLMAVGEHFLRETPAAACLLAWYVGDVSFGCENGLMCWARRGQCMGLPSLLISTLHFSSWRSSSAPNLATCGWRRSATQHQAVVLVQRALAGAGKYQ